MQTDIAKWKTDAWKSVGMAEQYQRNISNTTALTLLKNKRETELCSQGAIGKTLLDVGIGTGRGSQPLLAEGYELTGIDSSESMLNIARQNLSPYSPNLICGDLRKLPFPSESFDTLMSLNVLTHFPEWETILQEWQRVVKPNGRIISDFWSLDYDNLFGNDIIENRPEQFVLKVGIKQLSDFATKNNLKILSIIPYEELSDRNSLWTKYSGINKSEWDRLLSHAVKNQTFFDFLHFLQTALFAKMPTSFIRRYMVTFEKCDGPYNNEDFVKHHQKATEQFCNRFSLNELKFILGSDTNAFTEHLSHYLDDPYCLTFIFKLWSMVDFATDWLDLKSFLAEKHWNILSRWAYLKAMDTVCLDFVENWHRLEIFNESLSFHNVPLGSGLEYELISEVLTSFGAFNKETK